MKNTPYMVFAGTKSRYLAEEICKKYNTYLIVDEAHNYLSSQNIDKEDAIAKTCIETFESIIKEGRKFGILQQIYW